jgi:Cu/Ag efflux pump CusA
VARTIDIVAGVKGRSVDAVSADIRGRLQNSAFPLEYRAELMGDFAQQQAAKQRIAIAALGIGIGVIFILQAAFGSWALALAVGLTLPLAAGGGILAAAANGSAMSLAALGGLLTAVGIAARQTVLLVARYRAMRSREDMSFGPELVAAGIREHAAPIVRTALIVAGAVLPFAILGGLPGHEILGPLATVILGGLVTATLYSLCVVPALYSRFGAGAMPDPVDEEDLSTAV